MTEITDDLGPSDARSVPDRAAVMGGLRRSAGAARALVRRMARTAVGFVYPPSCVACTGAVAEPHGLCPQCWSSVAFIERPFCERLGTPFAVDIGGTLLSPAAVAAPPIFQRARAVARYDGVARVLVHRLKYGDRLELSLTLARMMTRAGREVLADADLLVPVPLHRFRLWTRRFNQAAALAAVVGRLAGVPLRSDVLVRRKRTRVQVGLTRAERAANMEGAFRVPRDAKRHLDGKRVVLIDDVLTTGSTANAAARALLRGGAASVDVLTFARTTYDG